MKELKVYVPQDGPYGLEPEEGGEPVEEETCYLKSDVDAVIDAKDAEIAEIKQRYNDMDIAHTVHIAKMNALIEELEESQRWRKFSEEKPQKGQKVLFRAKYKTDNIRTWIGEFRNVDFDVFYAIAPGWGCEFLPNEIFGWMPLPSAPKEEKMQEGK